MAAVATRAPIITNILFLKLHPNRSCIDLRLPLNRNIFIAGKAI